MQRGGVHLLPFQQAWCAGLSESPRQSDGDGVMGVRRGGQVEAGTEPRRPSSLARDIATMVALPVLLTVVVVVGFSLHRFPDSLSERCGPALYTRAAIVVCSQPAHPIEVRVDGRLEQRQRETPILLESYGGLLEYCQIPCGAAAPP